MFGKIATAISMVGFASAANANDLFGRPEYGPSGITRSIGYHDHPRSDGTWSVESSSTMLQRAGYAADMALYRAAEVATQQGHGFFQLLRNEGTIGTGLINRGAESVSLIVRFADSDAPPADCLQRGRHPGRCYTAVAASVLARLGPRIRDASWKLDRYEAERAPVPVVDHSGLVRFVTLFRFDLTEHGAIKNCSVVESSAPAELTANACRTFSGFARFRPEDDPAGRPLPSTRTVRVVWQLSDLGGPTTMIPLGNGTAVAPNIRQPTAPAALAVVTAQASIKPSAKPRRAFPRDDGVETPLQ